VGEDGGLIAGHARILAARQLGIAEIPVMVAAGWSEAQKRAYVLADNQLAITGSGWDTELLRLELGEKVCSANTSPPSRRARARARDGDETQRPWPADKVERRPDCGSRQGARRAAARHRRKKLKGRGRPTRSSGGLSIG
jgi:hypothetical protein